ncbi:hypothetical protein [Paenibacillus thalictri]|uniref:Uncharacterized protein n=1 Tax=Paenibacillus thalictri TaxID=2527873 RepID=A0A4Q9DVF2_9BACL|nr:hypothetical protein [Paenibacillus thalictri]TBL81017.1 hypothetical protein EYB31_02670 [Paenibacillus thalictri]
MLTIELNPQLHRVVHTMKNVEAQGINHPSTSALPLTKEESFAMISTFHRPAKDRSRELLEPRCDW